MFGPVPAATVREHEVVMISCAEIALPPKLVEARKPNAGSFSEVDATQD